MRSEIMKPINNWINTTFHASVLITAVCLVAPIFSLSLFFNDSLWQKASLVTMSLFIVHYLLNTTPLWVILHTILIALGFFILFMVIPVTWVFVFLCGLLAALMIRLAGWDKGLRTFGNYIFIPVLYLALELNENFTGNRFYKALSFLPYIFYSALPVLFYSIYTIFKKYHKKEIHLFKNLLQFQYDNEKFGEKKIDFVVPLIAVTIAVCLSALLVKTEAIKQGQWLIWSSASVITGEAAITVQQKLKDRLYGVLFGVPLGIAFGVLLPHSTFLSDFFILLSLLTLVAFKKYIIGFSLRCICIAIVITLMGGSVLTASERILNVFLGGVIVAFIFFATDKLFKYFHKKNI